MFERIVHEDVVRITADRFVNIRHDGGCIASKFSLNHYKIARVLSVCVMRLVGLVNSEILWHGN